MGNNAFITNGAAGQYIAGTSLVTGKWHAIQIHADAKFHTLSGTLTGVANTTSGSAPTIADGKTLYGNFTGIQLHSGAIIAYGN